MVLCEVVFRVLIGCPRCWVVAVWVTLCSRPEQ